MKNIPEQKIDPEKERIGMTGLAMPEDIIKIISI